MNRSTRNPFPGLRPFRSDEHHLFFGREDQTAALLQLLRENRFLAVVGTSGSGKSSLVRAGLIAELHSGTMTSAGSSWEVLIMRPGGSPVENLAREMIKAELYDPDDSSTLPRLRVTLGRSRFGLAEAVKQSTEIDTSVNLLVVVDQFEELFRFRQQGTGSEETATAFVNLMLTASEQAERPIYVVITMRSDYLGDCSEIPGLAEAVNRSEYLIPRLLRDQKRDAIEMPIGVGGARISPMLVQRILNDVGDDPDQLPVLQHALMRTWDVWSANGTTEGEIDTSSFEKTGGLASALSQHADEIFNSLPDDAHRRACQRVFKTLTEKGADNRGIRRPTRLDQLIAITGVERSIVIKVLEEYRKPGVTFLMPGPDKELTDRTVLDLSHESLMRGWDRLRRWVEDEAQSARVYRRLMDTSQLRQEGKAGLFRDPDLQITLSWREQEEPNEAWSEQYGGNFRTAIDFLERSRAESDAEKQADESRRQKELAQAKELADTHRLRAKDQKRAARRLGWLAAGLAVFACAALVLYFKAESASRDATTAADRLKEMRVRGEFDRSMTILDGHDNNAGLASLGLVLRHDDSYWQAGMRGLATMSQRSFVTDAFRVMKQERPIAKYDVHEDTGLVWSCDQNQSCVVWDSMTGKRLFTVGNGEPTSHLKFASSGETLAGLVGEQLHFWNTRTGEALPRTIDVRGMLEDYRLIEGRSGADRIAAEFPDGIRLWDAETGEAVGDTLNFKSNVKQWDVTPDSKKICALSRTGQFSVWDLSDGSIVREVSDASTPRLHDPRFHFANDSSYVVIVDMDVGERRAVIRGVDDSNRDWSDPLVFEKPIQELRLIHDRDLVAVVMRDAPDTRAGVKPNTPDEKEDEKRAAPETKAAAIPKRSLAQRSLVVRNTTSGAEIAKIAPRESVTAITFANERFALAAAVLDDHSIRVWDLTSGEVVCETSSQESLKSVQFSPDGRFLLGFGADRKSVRTWRISTGELAGRVDFDAPMLDYKMSPDGLTAFIWNTDARRVVQRWDLSSGQRIGEPVRLPGNHDQIRLLSSGLQAVSHVATWLTISGLTHGELVAWNTDSGSASFVPLLRSKSRILHAEYSRDGKYAAIFGISDGAVPAAYCEIRNADTRQIIRQIPLPYSANHATLGPNGKRVLIAADDGSATIYDVESGRTQMALREKRNLVRAAFHPDGDRIATVGLSTVTLWDTSAEPRPIWEVPSNQPVIKFSPNGRHLFVCGIDGRFLILDTSNGDLTLERDLLTDESGLERKTITLASFSEDGRFLQVNPYSAVHTLVVNAHTGEQLFKTVADEIVRSIDISPDGRLSVLGTGATGMSDAGQVIIKNVGTGGRTMAPPARGKYVEATRFGPDSELLATITSGDTGRRSREATVELWDVASGKPMIEPIRFAAGASVDVRFRPGGDQLLVWSDSGEVLLIDLPPRTETHHDWMLDLLAAVAGIRHNDSGATEPVGRELLASVRQRLRSSAGEDSTREWAQWILANRADRSIAPGVSTTRDELVGQLLASDDENNLKTALRLDPSNPHAFARMGQHLVSTDEYHSLDATKKRHRNDTALWYLQKAIEHDADDADVRAYQANVFYLIGDEVKAREAAKKAIAADPSNANALYVTAKTAAAEGDWPTANEAFNRTLHVLAQHPTETLRPPSIPALGILTQLQPSITWANTRSVRLPDPIVGTFEDFDAVAEGALPAGWTVANLTSDGLRPGTSDINDFETNAYRDWVTVSRSRIQSISRTDGQLLYVPANLKLNDRPVRRLLDGNFLLAQSDQRAGRQARFLFTPDFDCSGNSDVHVVFCSVFRQSRNTIAAVEYSIDEGQTWLPVTYRVSSSCTKWKRHGVVDPVATLTSKNFGIRSAGLAEGQRYNRRFSSVIAASVDSILPEYVAVGDERDVEQFRTVEVFSVPEADNRDSVRFRFCDAGADGWFWAVDRFGLYSLPDHDSIRTEVSEPVVTTPASDPDRLAHFAREFLDKDSLSKSDAIDARLLSAAAARQQPDDAYIANLLAQSLIVTDDVKAARDVIDANVLVASVTPRAWKTKGQLYEKLGKQYMDDDLRELALVCFELADMILASSDVASDASRQRMNANLVSVGLLNESRTILRRGSRWNYSDTGTDLGRAWRLTDFDDSSWQSGRAPMGFGDSAISHEVRPGSPRRHTTTYFRTEFVNVGQLRELRLSVRRDDGAVVYLNGEEIARLNMPSGAIGFDTFSVTGVAADEETRYFIRDVPASALREGRNVVAAEVHQATAGSSDLAFDLEISGAPLLVEAIPVAERLDELELELKIPDELRSALWARRANLFMNAGDDIRADESLVRATALNRQDPNVWWLRSLRAARDDQPDLAREHYKKAIDIASAHGETSNVRELFLGALPEFSKMSARTNSIALVAKGLIINQADIALWEVSSIEQILRDSGDESEYVLMARSGLLMKLEEYEAAIRLLERAETGFDADQLFERRADYRDILRAKEACHRALGQKKLADAVRKKRDFPDRQDGLSPTLIDLSDHYNASIHDGRGWTIDFEYDLHDVPFSHVPLKGVDFDLRGLIHLDGSVGDGQFSELHAVAYPDKVEGIKVDQTSPAIHFLMSTSIGLEEKGVEVATFDIHYDDGTSETVPIRFVDHVADWCEFSPAEVDPEQIGWRGVNSVANLTLSEIVWQNPHATKTISHIDFASTNAKAAPFLVAITLE